MAHAEQKPAFLHHVAPGGHFGGHAVAEAVVDAVEEDFFDEGFVAVGDEAEGAEFDAQVRVGDDVGVVGFWGTGGEAVDGRFVREDI